MARTKISRFDNSSAPRVPGFSESALGKPPALHHLQDIVDESVVVAFDSGAACACDSLLFQKASYDRLTAGRALSNGLTLVTKRHFTDLPGLGAESWPI